MTNDTGNKNGRAKGPKAAKLAQKRSLARAEKSHFAKAFRYACKIVRAEKQLAQPNLFSSTRTGLQNKVQKETEKLKKLAARDQSMTRLIAAYLRRDDQFPDAASQIRAWIDRERPADLGSYNDLIVWCATRRNELDLLSQQRALTTNEAGLVSALDKIDKLKNERTPSDRLRREFGAHGGPGRRSKKSE